VRPAHRDNLLSELRAEEWLLIEWPEDETEPTKYWFSTLPEDTAFNRLVDLTKLRWRIERDYQELKQELGLGDYEGRGWRGFHHHATLCIAAYGFRRAGRPSPLRTTVLSAARGIFHSRRLPTQRRRRSGPNATFQTRSRPCDDVSSSRSPEPSRDAPVATRQSEGPPEFPITDAVRLEFCLIIARFCVINNERITQIGTRATAWQCRRVADGAHACSAVWERICAVASDHEAVTGG
jgi:hypothetical protein